MRERLASPREDGIARPEIVTFAVRLMIDDALSGAVVSQRVADTFGLALRQAQRYVAAARDEIAATFRDELPSRAAVLAAFGIDTYMAAKEVGDIGGRNGAIRNLCTIYGITANVKISAPDALDALIEAARTSPGARDDEIAALEAKAAEDGEDGADAG